VIVDQERNGKALTMTYYTLTTLTTVGFGDYYPVTNQDRIFASILMFCGVIAFSFMQGNLEHPSQTKN
jgi:hypothetical protein